VTERIEAETVAAHVETCAARIHHHRDDRVEATVYRCEREAGHDGTLHWTENYIWSCK
jgi:hypothetical protein